MFSCAVKHLHGHLFLTLNFYLIFREKYLNTLLQVEMMLKLWFPQIPAQPVSTASSVTASPTCSLRDTSSSTPPHKHRDQLHIPVKVRTHTNNMMTAPLSHQHHHKLRYPYSLPNYCPAHFAEAQTQLDRYRLPHAFPCASQVSSHQYRREEGEARLR